MLIYLDYTRFNLRAGTESILYYDRAEWFFRDHNITHTVREDDQRKVIEWHEFTTVRLPISSIEQMQHYSTIYDISFVIDDRCAKIKFMRQSW